MEFELLLEEVNKHLDCSNQSWLFGAGISFSSNIPLMYPLTRRVEKLVKDKQDHSALLFDDLKSDLPTDYHIEHLLSHLVDFIAIGSRSSKKMAYISGECYELDKLEELYREIIAAITITIRYGYVEDNSVESERIGTLESPIVILDYHKKFVKTLLGNRANLINRSRINIFTTNYDTLLEDALAIENRDIVDGFNGGGIGYWCGEKAFERVNNSNSILLCKLHGSIDWYASKDTGLLRSRYGTSYLSDMQYTLIYPQASKYVETQKDPFATLFSKFRNTLNSHYDNVLITCGYSFGDEHINNEIELAMQAESNKTVLLAFAKEGDGGELNSRIKVWLGSSFGERVFVLTNKGIYNATNVARVKDRELNWWTFAGLTRFLEEGEI